MCVSLVYTLSFALQILDPPGSDPPPPRRGRRYDREEDDSDDAVEKRNAVNWGEEFPEGDSSVFLALGPNARVRVRLRVRERQQQHIRFLVLSYLQTFTDYRFFIAIAYVFLIFLIS